MVSTADLAIVVAGVVGPGLGYFAASRSDHRRFRHERALKASDDLRERLDEVAATLEALAEAAVGLRSETTIHAANRTPELSQAMRAAADAYQAARVSIARLEMRAHADDDVVKAAQEAAELLERPTDVAFNALILRRAEAQATPESSTELAEIPRMVEAGYGGVRRYQLEAKRADAALLGTHSPRRAGGLRPPPPAPEMPSVG